MSCANLDNLTLLHSLNSLFFSPLVALNRACITMLGRSGKNVYIMYIHACLIPNLKWEACSLSLWHLALPVRQ